MAELTALTEYCRRLGAPAPQAEAIARQLLKRADQLATERKQTREESLAYLLRLLAQGRAGEVAPEFQRPPGKSE